MELCHLRCFAAAADEFHLARQPRQKAELISASLGVALLVFPAAAAGAGGVSAHACARNALC